MTEKEAVSLFKDKHNDLVPVLIVDCGKYFVISAVEDPNSMENAIDPYYFVDKKTKDIGGFNPTDDLDNFTNPNNKVTKLI